MFPIVIPDDESTWRNDAFEAPYAAFNPRLLTTNDTLCNELLFAAHLIQIPVSPSSEDDTLNHGNPIGESQPLPNDVSQFVEVIADSLALDRPCIVCRIIDLYRRKFGLDPKWISDYAMLCSKCLSIPLCATSTFVAAFEFVYLMDKHYLRHENVTLVGAFARRTVTPIDIQRHFFLHGCFRTDGGMSQINTPNSLSLQNLKAGRLEHDKVQFSNYSFLIQSSTRAMLCTTRIQNTSTTHRVSDGTQPANCNINAPPQSLTTALVSWKDCAKLLDCSNNERRRRGCLTCCERAKSQDNEYEELLLKEAQNYRPRNNERDYADLVLLLLSGITTWEVDDRITQAARMRRVCVENYWSIHREKLVSDTAPRFTKFTGVDASPNLEFGPILLTTLKHAQVRGRTVSECILCNLLIIRDYWVALRRFKREVVTYSANNAGLFDCIPPILEAWKDEVTSGEAYSFSGDGGRFITLLSAVGTEAIYKHFFCDPMCIISELQTNPRVLFDHPTSSEKEDLELYKAQLASDNRFEGRVCVGLLTLAYTFKTYQVFPPKPTAGAAFIKDAGAFFRRHSISLVSLEHTLYNYV
ncbi:DNA packaging protein UL32 [Felid alphaherpesvirus 1]|uniref:Packaging protein UL32 n=1 Tax=Feline herpesvirus 1 TaxID=10334 RepID=D1FXV0_FHV1|nr:DNA packaging protein UL32 [Felid alphaherpesvirus 1]AMN88958.1 DNA packaging protein UL32 [synthetic construct]ACT88326.1 DNA packaging protein UL32 [Felid alphaherpesvirus 1]ALJ84078.1 DNA packaging protein UL32 [Felid alphaherpesvirus 1]ALJ84154.1 DNA packaging protein UL32 [Felid alphaherpesvirus 1]ALJ84230.1 DNA packaging protein UL32 [Felid alphaherpesvirus 1]